MLQYNRRRAAIVAAPLVLVGGSAVRAALAADTDIPPPAGATVVRSVQAGGAQVYTCRQAPSGPYQWSLVGPNAILVDTDGTTFGTHSAGPRWIASDGNAILGDVAPPDGCDAAHANARAAVHYSAVYTFYR